MSGFFAIQFLSDGTYDFTIDGTAYTSIKVKGGVVLYGDITSIASKGASTDAVALYKNKWKYLKTITLGMKKL